MRELGVQKARPTDIQAAFEKAAKEYDDWEAAAKDYEIRS
jgi:hypothetical protein